MMIAIKVLKKHIPCVQLITVRKKTWWKFLNDVVDQDDSEKHEIFWWKCQKCGSSIRLIGKNIKSFWKTFHKSIFVENKKIPKKTILKKP